MADRPSNVADLAPRPTYDELAGQVYLGHRWSHLIKGGVPRITEARVRVYSSASIVLPSALVDALGAPDRVHLFVSDTPGLLWICPAGRGDRTAFVLVSRRDANYRSLTASGIFERLRLEEPDDVLSGDWYVEDDRVLVRFDGEATSVS